jgi:hypothetical protein
MSAVDMMIVTIKRIEQNRTQIYIVTHIRGQVSVHAVHSMAMGTEAIEDSVIFLCPVMVRQPLTWGSRECSDCN